MISAMQHKKAILVKVLDGNHTPVNIQDWLEMEWGIYVEKELSQEGAYSVLEHHFEEQDLDFEYYLFQDELYIVETSEDIGWYNNYMVAEQNYEGINVDCIWDDSTWDFSECVNEALNKL